MKSVLATTKRQETGDKFAIITKLNFVLNVKLQKILGKGSETEVSLRFLSCPGLKSIEFENVSF